MKASTGMWLAALGLAPAPLLAVEPTGGRGGSALRHGNAVAADATLDDPKFSILIDAQEEGTPTCTPGKSIGLAALKPAFVTSLKASAGVVPFSLHENEGAAGAVVQTTFVTSTTSRHVDRLPPNEDGVRLPVPEGDLVTLVPLETNDDAHFDVENTCFSIKKGQFIHFEGGRPHQTVVGSGTVSLLGPFHAKTMKNVGGAMSMPTAPPAPTVSPAPTLPVPDNDECANAIEVSVPSTTTGTTTGATTDDLGVCNDNGAPVVWHKVTGTGKLLTASTCDDPYIYDTALSVFCGDCDARSCVAENDDDFDCSANSFQSTVDWCGEDGAEYLVAVHGFSSSSSGDFTLDLSEGADCTPPAELVCPTESPTESPTKNPTESPTKNPTSAPTSSPTSKSGKAKAGKAKAGKTALINAETFMMADADGSMSASMSIDLGEEDLTFYNQPNIPEVPEQPNLCSAASYSVCEDNDKYYPLCKCAMMYSALECEWDRDSEECKTLI
ncbi:hypothetical protein ACHAXT_009623 [Thalassiosira profunda]